MPRIRDSDTADGLAAIGLAFLAYGATEALGGYGFVAVFVSAVRLRDARRDDATHRRMAEFAGQIEYLVAMLVIVLFAGAVAHGLLSARSRGPTWRWSRCSCYSCGPSRPISA